VIISRYKKTDAAEKLMMNPVKTRINDLRFYSLNMSGINIAIKVDSRRLFDPYLTIWDQLIDNGILLVMEKKFKGSKEYEIIKRLIKNVKR